MHALTRLPSLHWLRLCMDNAGMERDIAEDWSLLSSLALRHLRRVWITSSSHLPNHALLHAVKQLPQLQSFVVFTIPTGFQRQRGWDVETLQALCQPPHQLSHLQSLGPFLNTTLTAEHMEQLVHLPSLTTLRGSSLAVDALPFLPHFHHLSELSVDIAPNPPSTQWIEVAAPSLAQCPSLKSVSVTMSLIGFDDHDHGRGRDQLDLLLRSLPHLRTLAILCRHSPSDLHRPGQNPTLESLTHVAHTLEQLQLDSAGALRPLPRLPPLPLLHTLTVNQHAIMFDTSRDRERNGDMQEEDESDNPLMTVMRQMGITRQRTPMLKTIKIDKAEYDVTNRLAEVDDSNEGNMAAVTPIMDAQGDDSSASASASPISHPHPLA